MANDLAITENLHSCGARTRASNNAVCPANHLAITAAITVKFQLILLSEKMFVPHEHMTQYTD